MNEKAVILFLCWDYRIAPIAWRSPHSHGLTSTHHGSSISSWHAVG